VKLDGIVFTLYLLIVIFFVTEQSPEGQENKRIVKKPAFVPNFVGSREQELSKQEFPVGFIYKVKRSLAT